MLDDPSISRLVTRAAAGDQQTWNALVERYAPLVWAICRRHQLSRADAEDVSQTAWLRLATDLASLRDPAALPGWLATTTQRECIRILRAPQRPAAAQLVDYQNVIDGQTSTAEEQLLAAERRAALRAAFSQLPPRCQQLLTLLTEDPPVPYAQISATLGIPVGSIGPLRSRCLDRLRRHPAIAALITAETGSTRPPALVH